MGKLHGVWIFKKGVSSCPPFLSVWSPAFPLPGAWYSRQRKIWKPFSSLCTLHCAGPCSVSYFFRKSQVLETIVGILHSLLPSLWLLVLRELKTPVEVMSPKIRDTDGHVWRKSLQAWGTLVRTRNQIPITEEARMGSGIPPSLRSHFLG